MTETATAPQGTETTPETAPGAPESAPETQPAETPAEGEPSPEEAPAGPAEPETPTEPAPEAAPAEGEPATSEEGGEAPAEEAAADPYAELALAEGSELAPAVLDSVKEFAAEHELSFDTAKALLEREEGRLESAKDQWHEYASSWKSDLQAKLSEADWIRADAELSALITRFAPEGYEPGQLLQDLQDSGYAYNPIFFGLMSNIATAMRAPSEVVRGPPTEAPALTEDEEWVREFYNSGPMPGAGRSPAHATT